MIPVGNSSKQLQNTGINLVTTTHLSVEDNKDFVNEGDSNRKLLLTNSIKMNSNKQTKQQNQTTNSNSRTIKQVAPEIRTKQIVFHRKQVSKFTVTLVTFSNGRESGLCVETETNQMRTQNFNLKNHLSPVQQFVEQVTPSDKLAIQGSAQEQINKQRTIEMEKGERANKNNKQAF